MSQRKRLFDMEIDEISLVDRGANQHAAIVISKALGPEEDSMPEVDLYDADGDLVESLEHGDVVYDTEGNEYVYVEEDESEDYDEFGKALFNLDGVRRVGTSLKGGFQQGRKFGDKSKGVFQGPAKVGAHFGRNVNRYAAGGAVAVPTATGAAGYLAGNRVEKSLGDVVMEELSKAASEDERNEIIGKAMEEVEIAKAAAEEAWERVAAQDDAMLESAFISKAAEYNLPVDPVEFGQILKAASTVLDYEQLDLLDQLFNAVGEALYQEVGYVGDTDNDSVLNVVNGYVGEMIGKSDYSPEELTTAVFEANPDAYDAYLAENRW